MAAFQRLKGEIGLRIAPKWRLLQLDYEEDLCNMCENPCRTLGEKFL